MKKYIILIAIFVGVSNFASAQNVVIQSNTTPTQQSVDSNQYYINGISTREDIGGVQIERGKVSDGYYPVKLTNYNNFPVSVIYQFNYGSSSEVETGTMVLDANSWKETGTGFKYPRKFVVIARKLSN